MRKEANLSELRSHLLKCNSTLSKSDDYCLLRTFYPQLVIAAARKRREEILKHVKPKFVLDAGCGEGWLSLEAAKNGFNIIAIELLESRIKEAKALFKSEKVEIPILKASLTHLPLRDSIFESVISCEVIEHIHKVNLVFSEMRRVLSSCGRLCLTTPNGYGSFGIFHDLFLPAIGKRESGIEAKHVQRFTKNNLNILVKRSGFVPLLFFNLEVFTPFYDLFFSFLGLSRSSWQWLERADVENSSKLTLWFGGTWVLICKKS